MVPVARLRIQQSCCRLANVVCCRVGSQRDRGYLCYHTFPMTSTLVAGGVLESIRSAMSRAPKYGQQSPLKHMQKPLHFTRSSGHHCRRSPQRTGSAAVPLQLQQLTLVACNHAVTTHNCFRRCCASTPEQSQPSAERKHLPSSRTRATRPAL